MRKFIALALAGAALTAAAAPAFAEAARWTDAEYLRASRCLGLAEAKALGPVDASALTARVKDQGPGREPYLRDRAGALREEARRAGRTGGEDAKAKLMAEREGACQAYLSTEVAAN